MKLTSEHVIRHTIIYLYDSGHSYVYGQVHRNLQFLKTELSYDTDFWIWVYIHGNSKMIQSFQIVQ